MDHPSSRGGYLARLKAYIGPLGWGGLVVFFITRCGDIASLLYKVILGRWLPALDFGAIDPVYSLLALFSIPITILYQSGAKSISRLQVEGRDAEVRQIIAHLALVAAVGTLVAMVAIYALHSFLLSRLHLDSRFYIALIGGLFALAWWEPLYGAILQGIRHYRLLALPAMLNPLLLLVFVGLMVGIWSWGLKGALLARIVAGVITLLAVFIGLRYRIKGCRASYASEWPYLKETLLPMAVFCVSTTLLLHFDRLFVRNFYLDDSGGYGAIVTWGSIPIYLIGSIVFVIFPLAAAEHMKGRSLRRYYLQAVGAALIITVITVVFFACCGRWLLGLWNPVFSPYAGYLWMYALAAGLLGVIQIVASVEMARHRYECLWALFLPTLIMVGVLYGLRAKLALSSILGIIVGTRFVILLGMVAVGHFAHTLRRNQEEGSESEERLK